MAAKQFLVVGLGRFGLSVATSLYENGNEVMAVDIDGAVVEDVQDRVTHAVQADMTDPEIKYQAYKAIYKQRFPISDQKEEAFYKDHFCRQIVFLYVINY